jgi:pimeloyl-ACP methyl ester carboxylesterase
MAERIDVVVLHDDLHPKRVQLTHGIVHAFERSRIAPPRARIVLGCLPMALAGALGQLIGLERLSTLREMTLVHRDLVPDVPAARPGDDVVVLVHGFMATAGVFRPLRARLERETGACTATFTHAPCVGIKRIAQSLEALMDRIPQGTRITIVGHSLGGVVARWYVQEMGGAHRVAQTISLGSPFGGVDVPRYFVGADLHEQSDLLRQLRDGARRVNVPHTSVVGLDDTLVPGVTTASLGVGEVVLLAKRGHNTLLFDDEVAELVISRVRRPVPPIASVGRVAVVPSIEAAE